MYKSRIWQYGISKIVVSQENGKIDLKNNSKSKNGEMGFLQFLESLLSQENDEIEYLKSL